MHATLFYNPKAGDKDFSSGPVPRLLKEAGYQVRYASTKDAHYRASFDEAADLIIAAGGDGTVVKIASELAWRDLPLAILPMGTANNIATGLGIAGDLKDIIASWSRAKRRNFDFWTALGPWGEKPIVEGLGLGAIADVAQQLGDKLDGEERAKKLALAREALRRQIETGSAVRVKAEFDDQCFDGEVLFLEALNAGFGGPRLMLSENADTSDGKIDIVIAEPAHKDALLSWLRSGEVSTVPAPVLCHRCRHLGLEWSGGRLRLEDNNFWPGAERTQPTRLHGKMELKLSPAAVTVLMPIKSGRARTGVESAKERQAHCRAEV